MINNLSQNKQLSLVQLKAREYALYRLIEQAVESELETRSQFLGLIHNNIDEIQREIEEYE